MRTTILKLIEMGNYKCYTVTISIIYLWQRAELEYAIHRHYNYNKSFG